MKWMTIWKVGKKVLDVADTHGLKLHGLPIGEVEKKIETVVGTTKTLVDVFRRP